MAVGADIGDVTAPELIWCRYGELPIQHVRNIRPLHRQLFVAMRSGLLADQSQLAYQLAHFESSNLDPVLAHHDHDAPAARSAAALGKQLAHPAT